MDENNLTVMEEEITEAPQTDKNDTEAKNELQSKKDKIKDIVKKHKKLFIIVLVLLVITGLFVSAKIKGHSQKNAMGEIKITVERHDIKKTVSGSSVIEPKDSYNVTAMVTGEITADTFNEGDIVKKDDVLYQIDAETVEQSVQSSQNSLTKGQNALTKAKQSYDDAVKSQKKGKLDDSGSVAMAQNALEKAQRAYNDAMKTYSDLNVKSDMSGTVTEVLVKEGDSIQNGGKIAAVYSDKYMKLILPFNENDADEVHIGDGATVTVAGTGDEIWGSVTAVENATVATDSHAQVRYVTIELENPGALTVKDKATAVVNGVASNNVGSFEYIESGFITAKASGTIDSVNINDWSSVSAGQTVAVIKSDTIETTIANALSSVEDAGASLEKTQRASDGSQNATSVQNAKLALDDAKLALEDAKINLDKSKKNLEDYTIKAPIDGTVVTKNKKKGDKLESGSNANSSSAMAVIFDLSSLKIQMTVDETEVHLVKVGQEVSITADAIEGAQFKGVVTKVGIDGTSSNGVTTYPIDVEITEYGDLLPGMNVDAEIVVDEVKNALAIPVTSVQRGNTVYVKGEKEDENDNAPDGYKSVEVELGINDEDFIEVKKGLNEGDELKGIERNINDLENFMQGMQSMHGGMGGGMSGPPSGGGMSGGGNRQGGGMSGGMR